MLTLAIRTDKPESELYLLEDNQVVAKSAWQAHRQLAASIHKEISELLHTYQATYTDLQSIVLFGGPGSFTGLRIGAAVANALAESLKIPVYRAQGEDWLTTYHQLQPQTFVAPVYGSEAHTTAPKK